MAEFAASACEERHGASALCKLGHHCPLVGTQKQSLVSRLGVQPVPGGHAPLQAGCVPHTTGGVTQTQPDIRDSSQVWPAGQGPSHTGTTPQPRSVVDVVVVTVVVEVVASQMQSSVSRLGVQPVPAGQTPSQAGWMPHTTGSMTQTQPEPLDS